MQREMRRVPANWQHPRKESGSSFKPLLQGFQKDFEEFSEMARVEGMRAAVDSLGQAPKRENYMPEWTEEEATHFQMYENTSEGTPVSPVMESSEKLARWLVENNASAFAGQPVSYEAWLKVAKGDLADPPVVTCVKNTDAFEFLEKNTPASRSPSPSM